MKLAYKLPLLIVSTALVLTAVLIAVSTSNFRRGVLEKSEVFMQSLVQDRELALQSYFEGIEAAILTIASVPSTADAMKDLTATWSTRAYEGQAEVQNLSLFASAASPYEIHFERNHPAFKRVMERMGFYDIFLISPAGDVVFSVTKESDYASNMITGQYRGTGLAKAFRMAEDGEATGFISPTSNPMRPVRMPRRALRQPGSWMRQAGSQGFSPCRLPLTKSQRSPPISAASWKRWMFT